MLSVIITSCSTVLEEDVAAVHAGVLADDRVPRGLDGQDLLSAEEVTTRVEVAALVHTQALAEIVIHLEANYKWLVQNKAQVRSLFID